MLCGTSVAKRPRTLASPELQLLVLLVLLVLLPPAAVAFAAAFAAATAHSSFALVLGSTSAAKRASTLASTRPQSLPSWPPPLALSPLAVEPPPSLVWIGGFVFSFFLARKPPKHSVKQHKMQQTQSFLTAKQNNSKSSTAHNTEHTALPPRCFIHGAAASGRENTCEGKQEDSRVRSKVVQSEGRTKQPQPQQTLFPVCTLTLWTGIVISPTLNCKRTTRQACVCFSWEKHKHKRVHEREDNHASTHTHTRASTHTHTHMDTHSKSNLKSIIYPRGNSAWELGKRAGR